MSRYITKTNLDDLIIVSEVAIYIELYCFYAYMVLFFPVFMPCILFARVICSTYMALTFDCDLYIYIPAVTSLLLDSDFYQQAASLYLVVEYYMTHKLNMGNIHLIYIFSLFSCLPT